MESGMPRGPRIDTAGSLHHVTVRGIARKKIFYDDEDRDDFLDKLGILLKAAGAACYAWALIPNHFHLLLKTGETPLSTLMRRLLTGYALHFNRRHRRWGHLFQNRYKSILCQEDSYLLELVRYIHLNPLRAGLVENYDQLGRFSYCGHGVILGSYGNDWQDTGTILNRFGTRAAAARRRYRDFVEAGIELGKREDLIGGGLVRSNGGWTEVKALRRAKAYVKGDARILGDGDFVKERLAEANEQMERKYRMRALGFDVDKIAARVGEVLGIDAVQVFAFGKNRETVRARSLLCYWAVRECGIPMAELSRRLEISATSVGQSVRRGERLAAECAFQLLT